MSRFPFGFSMLRSHYRAFVGFRPVGGFWGHYFNPLTYINFVKYFCQRGWRGYADCDHWCACNYFEEVMLGVIRDLKAFQPGAPCTIQKYQPGEIPPEGYEDDSQERWQAILSEIIEGLEASLELESEETVLVGTYSDEPIVWKKVQYNGQPCACKGKCTCIFWAIEETETPRFNQDLFEQWEAPLKKKKRRAMLLLCKYWENLWN